jgi:uncharacterized protein YkwD
MRDKITRVVFILLIVASFSYAGRTQASTFFTSIKSGVSDIFVAINSSVVKITRDSFCDRFFKDKANGAYITEIRGKSAIQVCVNYTPKAEKVATAFETKSDKINQTLSSKNLAEVLKVFSPISEKASNFVIDQVDKIKTIENKVEPLKENVSYTENSFNLSSSGILTETNKERASLGLVPLSMNPILNEIALNRMKDMFGKGYFEHTSPDGKTVSSFAKSESYEYLVIGENIALGNFSNNKELLSAWMASPGHKANIINSSYSEIGIAVSKNSYQGSQMVIAVQVFAKPQKDCSYPNQDLKIKVNSYTQSIKNLVDNAEKVKAELNVMKTNGTSASKYNDKVAEYNLLAKLANTLSAEIKELTASYNLQVGIYNECINKI